MSPSTGLSNGASVSVSGSGFTPGLGVILECNSDPAQPTVSVSGSAVPVSCSSPFNALINFDASGNLAATLFTVHSGTVGPPAAGTDSAGHDAAADAALWPCPPTAAQVTAGASCVIALADIGGDKATQTISFGEGSTTTSTTGSSTTSSSVVGGTTTTTKGGTTTTSAGAGTTTTSRPATTSSTAATTTTVPPSSTTTTSTPIQRQPSLTGSTSTVSAGQDMTVTGKDFPSQTTLDVSIHSTPVTLTSVTTDQNGGFRATVTIPASTAAGAHELVATTGDGALSAVFPITVVAATPPGGTTTTLGVSVLGTQTTNTPLAFTGVDARAFILLGVGCLAVGFLVYANAGLSRRA